MVELISMQSETFTSHKEPAMLEWLPWSKPWLVAAPELLLALGKEGANPSRLEVGQKLPL